MARYLNDWRVIAGIVAASFIALGWSEARVRTISRTQAVEVIAAEHEQFKRDAIAAAEAAAERGAEKAIRESVAPIAIEVVKHTSQDEQAQRDTERRLETLERRGR